MSGPRQIGWPELKAGGFYHTTSRQCFKVVASRGTAGDPLVVWGLSYYDGSWAYRTLGRSLQAWLMDLDPSTRFWADYDRLKASPAPPLGPAVVTQRQLAQLLGTHLEGITILRAYNGIGFGTDQGTYGVAMRDGGLEVMLDGFLGGPPRPPIHRTRTPPRKPRTLTGT